MRMTRLASILLSGLLLLQGLNLSLADLARMDELLEHARYHREHFGDSFLTFLDKHYGDLKEAHERDHREEQPQHEKLPFQQMPQQGTTHMFLFPAPRLSWEGFPELPEPGTHTFYTRLVSPGIFVDGVFQPPRPA